ncbi:hypothetical protein ABIA30_000562 [Mycobacterium sp. MAA66]
MSIIHFRPSPNTWRNPADQLTPEQVAYRELSEQNPVP